MKKTILRFSAAVMMASVLFACHKEMSTNDASACGQLRTQTQGGWGAEPSGNNSGVYLHANFQAAFGDSFTVGCYPHNYYVKLTSAQAVTNLLPIGGKAMVLTSNSVDPASLNNVLVGQLVALKLSVGFDAYDANFGESSVALGDMIIGSGTFEGSTVFEFLAIAEQVLGGCNSAYKVEQVIDIAASINQNFVDGKTNNGFLVCPEDGDTGGGGEPLPG
jgi:hypothetical protein